MKHFYSFLQSCFQIKELQVKIFWIFPKQFTSFKNYEPSNHEKHMIVGWTGFEAQSYCTYTNFLVIYGRSRGLMVRDEVKHSRTLQA